MPYSKKAMFSWKSAVVGSLKGSPTINTKTSKHQNFPGGGVGARSHAVRSAISRKCEPCCTTTTDTIDDTTAPDYYTPVPFTSILTQSFSGTLPSNRVFTPLTTLKRYTFKYEDTIADRYLTIDDSFNLTLTTSVSTYKDVLSKMMEVCYDAPLNTFRLDSELHALYTLDCSSNSSFLTFSNNWGENANQTCGYLEFQYVSQKLKVISRQKIDVSYAHMEDQAFNAKTYYVSYDVLTQRFKLTANAANGATFQVYESPINADIPADFNPYQVPYQPNLRVPIYKYVIGTGAKNSISRMTQDIMGSGNKMLSLKYRSQVSAVGWNAQTESAANTMLDDIFKAVGSAEMRYSPSVYKAFRKAALNTTLGGNSIANGTLGQNTVPYVYYTLELSGNQYHPFMVMASYSISDKPNRLLDVCRPPADGDNYASDNVTRDATLQNYLTKIPMRNYGNITVSTLEDNNMKGSTLLEDKDAGKKVTPNMITVKTPYNYASISAIGIAVDGVVIYPIANNTLHPAQAQAEITNTGIHIGRGMGLHYHADGKSASPNHLNLYNSKDYVGHYHPPLIGFGFDGIALYGQYDANFPQMHGYSTALDEFGGHSHGNYGYHYHAHVVKSNNLTGLVNNTSGVNGLTNNPALVYDVHILMKGAWAGKINSIPEFWDGPTPNYTIGRNNSTFVGF